MKHKFILGKKLICLGLISAMVISLSSCGILERFGLGGSNADTASEPSPSASAAAQLTQEELIIGEWGFERVVTPAGEYTSLSQVDLTGTPLEDYADILSTVLENGAVSFSDDGTVSFSILSADYTLSGGRLTISSSLLPTEMSIDCNIDGDEMELSEQGVTIYLARQ